MKTCRDIEPLLASYVDGEGGASDRADVQEHLDACPPCREAAGGQRTARDVLAACRDRLRDAAPPGLRGRCAARAAAPASRAALAGWRTLVPLSMAATILLAVAGLFVYSAVNEAEALAAQVAFDHAKCARLFAPDHGADARLEAARWEHAHGWPVQVAGSAPEHDLEFLTIRRCLLTDGSTAHLMYKWRGEPLSVFVVPDAVRSERVIARFGYDATMWSEGGRTYVVVSNGGAADTGPMVRYVRAHVR